MLLSTEFNYASILFGTEKAIEIVTGAGFDGLDYSMFDLTREDNPLTDSGYERRLSSFRKIAADCGACFNQTHAPFPSFKEGDGEYNRETFPRLIRSIEATAILGAPHVVMHPQPVSGDSLQRNVEFFGSLAPYCKEYGVKIAIENLIPHAYFAKPEELGALVDALPSEHFTALVDVGHASINGSDAAELLRGMGSRVGALHVHDNDHVNDCHNMPFNRKLDWQSICAALKEIGYSGDFTYEAGFYVRQFPKELAAAAYRMMAETGRYLMSLIND
ncbi:MAG: sugar phosphate isomerase/epimerase [Clostridia bacterium]|nr:sugar phosphate isomerase/epimerase [Clostridia bacterium]